MAGTSKDGESKRQQDISEPVGYAGRDDIPFQSLRNPRKILSMNAD